MTQVTDWQFEDKARVFGPFLRIYDWDSKSRPDESRIYINKAAYGLLGQPDFVQVMVSTANGSYRVKLLPCSGTSPRARRLNVRPRKGMVFMGGGPNLHKRYGLPKGYYLMDESKVFTWNRV